MKKKNERLTFLIALVLAVIAWIYVMNEENPSITREFRPIPVKLLNADELENRDLVIMEPVDPVISVTLSGLRNTLYNINANQIIAEVDLRGYDEGVARAPVHVRQPAETSVYAMSDRDILFTIERIVERTLTVETEVDDNTLERDFKYKHTVEPATITIKGPRSLANRVHEARVIADHSGERESFTITERIELVDVDGKPVQGLEMSTDTVSVSVEVKRVKVVPIVISHTGSLPEGVTIVNERIEPNTIRVQGPDEIVQNLENIRTESIDYSEMNVSGERKVGLQFPEGVTEDETIEPVYTYNVRTPVDRDMIIGRSAIELRNPPEDTNARIGDGNPIVVRLSGEEEDLDALRENQIKLYLDLDGLQAGIHEVQVQMEPIPNLRFDPEAFPEIRVIIDEVTTENME